MHPRLTRAVAVVAASAMTLLPTYPAYAQQSGGSSTKTPIKHVVVIFQENVSFDHYFGTYPHAFNLPSETPFHAKDDTPESNTLLSSGLLTHNQNKANPFRIPPSVPVTCDEHQFLGHYVWAIHSGGAQFGCREYLSGDFVSEASERQSRQRVGQHRQCGDDGRGDR